MDRLVEFGFWVGGLHGNGRKTITEQGLPCSLPGNTKEKEEAGVPQSPSDHVLHGVRSPDKAQLLKDTQYFLIPPY